MDLENLSLMELKALAYDRIASLEQVRAELDRINQLIAKKMKEAASE